MPPRKGECRRCGLPRAVSNDHSVFCTWHPSNRCDCSQRGGHHANDCATMTIAKRHSKEKDVPKKKPETDNSLKPWVSNYPPLKTWLDKHDAHCMWQVPGSEKPDDALSDWHPQFYIECWLVNRHPVIIIVRADKMGWDVYTAADTPAIDATLLDAERRVGLDKA